MERSWFTNIGIDFGRYFSMSVLTKAMITLFLMLFSIQFAHSKEQYSLNDARRLLKEKRIRACYEASDQLIKAGKSTGAYELRGRSAMALGLYDKAAADLTMAIKLSPNNHKLFFYRAEAYKSVGDFAGSAKDLTRCISANPGQVKYLKARATAYMVMRNNKLAIEDLTAAMQIEPENEYFVKQRGKLFFDNGQLKESIKDLSKAIEIIPDHANSYFWRGCAYLKTKQYGKAVEDFSKEIQLDKGKNAAGFQKRAEAYEKLGKKAEAKLDRLRASKIDDFEL